MYDKLSACRHAQVDFFVDPRLDDRGRFVHRVLEKHVHVVPRFLCGVLHFLSDRGHFVAHVRELRARLLAHIRELRAHLLAHLPKFRSHLLTHLPKLLPYLLKLLAHFPEPLPHLRRICINHQLQLGNFHIPRIPRSANPLPNVAIGIIQSEWTSVSSPHFSRRAISRRRSVSSSKESFPATNIRSCSASPAPEKRSASRR